MRYLIFIALFLSLSTARENPFIPDNSQQNFQSTDSKSKKDPLDVVSITLPTSAREVKKVAITYKNIDGTLAVKEVPLDNIIDWRYPIKITQADAMKKILRRYFKLRDFEFFIDSNLLSISTKRVLVRDFLVASPLSVVLDFKRDKDTTKDGLYEGEFDAGLPYFSKVLLQTHGEFYRVILQLDGQSVYSLKKKANSYEITIK